MDLHAGWEVREEEEKRRGREERETGRDYSQQRAQVALER
jgi:hypothetical protein